MGVVKPEPVHDLAVRRIPARPTPRSADILVRSNSRSHGRVEMWSLLPCSLRTRMSALRFPLLYVLFVLFLGCRPESSNKLVVGMELNYPPFEMIDSAGHPTGISVEMANALGKFLQREVQIQNVP